MKRILSVLLVLSMLIIFLMVPAAASMIQYIAFGSYPQSEVEATDELLHASYDSSGDTVVNGERYRRVQSPSGEYHYFIYEPILWEDIGNGTYLAKDIIECQPYDAQDEKYTPYLGRVLEYADPTSWEECSLRPWLSGSFSGAAFTADEQGRLDEISLLTFGAAKQLERSSLEKAPTDYAAALGVEGDPGDSYFGNGTWMLKDLMEIHHGVVCTVLPDGNPVNTALKPLVNEGGLGVVPCITLSSSDGLSQVEYTNVSNVSLYAPGGRTIRVPEADAAVYTQHGWYSSENEARAHWIKRSVEVAYNKVNPSSAEVIGYANDVMNQYLTGDPRDYTEISVTFNYDRTCGAKDYQEFQDTIYKQVCTMFHAFCTSWGTLISSNSMGAAELVQAEETDTGYTITVYFKVNGENSYSSYINDYYAKLHEVTSAALASSDRPREQFAYIKKYLEDNTKYNIRVSNNAPESLLLGGEGVCGSYANLVHEMCLMLGIPCFVVQADTAHTLNHAWNRLYLEGTWYDVDFAGPPPAAMWTSNHPDEAFFPGMSFQPYIDLSEEEFASLQQVFEKAQFPVLSDPGYSLNFWDLDRSQYYYNATVWAVERGIAAGTGGGAVSPDDNCTVGQILTFLWRAAGSPEPTGSSPFSDIQPSDYFYKPALWAYTQRMVTEAMLKPDTLCTRAMAVTYLWKLAGSPVVYQTKAFSDVPTGSDDAQAVAWAVATGITFGTGSTTFSPDVICTRGQIITLLWRAASKGIL